MNTNNLKENMTVKNYKELCELIDEPQKVGKSKQLQLSNWRKYFEFKKDKNKFIIKEVYESPNTLTYSEKVELLLLHLMSTSEHSNYTIFAPKTTILEQLHIINREYRYTRQNVEKLSNDINIDSKVISDFFNSVSSSINYQLEKVLKSLTKRGLIEFLLINMVCCTEREYDINDVEINNKNIYRKATVEEIEFLLHVKRTVFNELECESVQDTIKKGKYDKYIKRCTELFSVEDINFFYKAYEIVFSKKHINTTIDKYVEKYKLTHEQRYNMIQETNIEHMNSIITNATNRKTKAIVKRKELILDDLLGLFGHTIESMSHSLNMSNSSLELILLRSDENYVDNIEKLTQLLIKNNITYENPIRDKGDNF